MKVLRLEVSVYNVYIASQFQTTFAQVGGGGSLLMEVSVNSKEERVLKLMSQLLPRIRPLDSFSNIHLHLKVSEIHEVTVRIDPDVRLVRKIY